MELFPFLLYRLDHLDFWFYVLVKVVFSQLFIGIFYAYYVDSPAPLGVEPFRLSRGRLAVLRYLENLLLISLILHI
jgi:hypothetical protein